MIPDRVVAFTKKFKGRLEAWRLEDILNCVGHGETALAFEMLCDFIAEFDIPISMEEYDEIMRLAVDIELDSDSLRYKCLKALVS